ncbi:MAG: DKNYY domain-containing protein [Pirellulaceae bacterium]
MIASFRMNANSKSTSFLVCVVLVAVVALGCRDMRIGSRVKPYFYYKNGKGHYCIPTDPHTYRGAIVRDFKADEDTFETVPLPDDALPNALPYARDRSHVWLGIKKIFLQLKAADPETFTVISEDGRYAKDKNSVYYCGVRLPDADPTTFAILTRPYAVDENHVFAGHEVLEIADPETFEVLEHGYAGIPWELELDIPKLRSTTRQPTSGLAKDSTRFFFGVTAIEPADYDSFHFVGHMYAKDKLQVYFFQVGNPNVEQVLDADPGTFQLGESYPRAFDKNHYYEFGRVVKPR